MAMRAARPSGPVPISLIVIILTILIIIAVVLLVRLFRRWPIWVTPCAPAIESEITPINDHADSDAEEFMSGENVLTLHRHWVSSSPFEPDITENDLSL
jgi:hypothetical protein